MGVPKIKIHFVPALGRWIGRLWDNSRQIHKFGSDNLFPQELIKLVSQSAPALTGIRGLAQFTFGTGFTDEAVAKFKCKGNKTANQILLEIADQMSFFSGFALYIMRDLSGNISWVDTIRIEYLRKDFNGDFIYNEFFDTPKYKEVYNQRFPKYAGREITTEQFMHNLKKFGSVGEILYVYRRDAISVHYPFPDYFAAEFDIKSSAEYSLMDYENAVNSWMTSALITLIGDIDDENKDDNGKTEMDYHVDELSKLTGKNKDSKTGLSGRNKFAVLSAKNKDEAPIIQTFPIDKFISGTIAKKEANAKDVLISIGIHPVLVGYSDPASLGNKTAMANAVIQANNRVSWRKELITQTFDELYPEQKWEIGQYIPFKDIPDKVIEKMTDDEIRSLAGLPPIEKGVPSDAEKTLQLLNQLSPLVANKVLEALTDDELRSLIALPGLTDTQRELLKQRKSPTQNP